MNNYVKIHYSGRDYVGQLLEVVGICESYRNIIGKRSVDINGYKIKLLEKDTNTEIDHIYVKKLSGIKPYSEELSNVKGGGT